MNIADSRIIHEIYDGTVETEVIDEAISEMKKGVDGKTRFDDRIFEYSQGKVYASISMRPGEGIETFKCNCGYKGKGYCKHFIYLTSAASVMVAKLSQENKSKRPISTLEFKIKRSLLVPPEIKTLFQKFSQDFKKLWVRYIKSHSPYEAKRNLKIIYDERNKVVKSYLGSAYSARKSKKPVAAAVILLYGLFEFYRIIGYDNSEMLEAIEYHVPSHLRATIRGASATEKEKIWDFLAKALLIKTVDKLPELPILELLIEVLQEGFVGRKYQKRNLALLDELINVALIDDDEAVLERLVVEYLWILKDTNISEEELYREYREWWWSIPVRLNYLEHCVDTSNFLTAFTLTQELLKVPQDYDTDEDIRLHQILCAAAFKLGKKDIVIRETNYLAKESPEILIYELKYYMMADKKRWPKIKAQLGPILKRTEKRYYGAMK